MPGAVVWTCAVWAYAALLSAATQPGQSLTAAVLGGALVTGAVLAGATLTVAVLVAARWAGQPVGPVGEAHRRTVSVRRRSTRRRAVRALDPDAAGRPRPRAPGWAVPAG